MRLLGIDFGKKRIGIALSDPLGLSAQPYTVLQNDKNTIEKIRDIIKDKDIGQIVIGLPKTLKGEMGIAANDVLIFAEKIKKTFGLPVETYDERLTTSSAERELIDADVKRSDRKLLIDKMAAANILQDYMDKADYLKKQENI